MFSSEEKPTLSTDRVRKITDNVCKICDRPTVAMVVDWQNSVTWCEDGHVVVADPDLVQGFKLVWDFHRDAFDKRGC